MSSAGPASAQRRLGRYHLAERLGEGPTGEVFRASVVGAPGDPYPFALKRFHAGFLQDADVAARLREAGRQYGRLQHPRIARLHEYAVAGGETFAVTEFVPGLDVGRLLAATRAHELRLLPGAAATLVSQAARAMGYAHGRGVCHFGICPTNLICTPQGDLKVVDFGFLPCRLPARPGDDPDLAERLPYLAPEQLAHNQTSAATDVFQLAVIAAELMTGEPRFAAGTPTETVKLILASAPAAPPDLPPPVREVLERCWAPAPEARFPNAVAFADALDAAVRVAALSGGRRDAGSLVQQVLERLSPATESAPRAPVLAPKLELQTTPLSRLLDEGVAMRHNSDSEAADVIHGGGDRPLAISNSGEEEDTSVRTREPGSDRRAAARPDSDYATTRVGDSVAVALEEGPTFADKSLSEGGRAVPLSGAAPAEARAESEPDERARAIAEAETLPGTGRVSLSARPAAPARGDSAPPLLPPPPGGEHPLAPAGHEAYAPPRSPFAETPLAAEGPNASPAALAHDEVDGSPPSSWDAAAQAPPIDSFAAAETGALPSLSGAPLSARSDSFAYEPDGEDGSATQALRDPPPAARRHRANQVLLAAILVCIAAVGGVVVYDSAITKSGSDGVPLPDVKAPPTHAQPATSPPPSRPVRQRQHRTPAAVIEDEGAAAADKPAKAPAAEPGEPAATLRINSKPDGAKVYLDGTEQGTTPVELDASDDSHTLALILPGYELHVAEIAGRGEVSVDLKEVAPPGGPAGIKVRCKIKNRYYVLVDGRDIGQLCPTERVGVHLGRHMVEIYDPITENRRVFHVHVRQTRHSLRVYVD